MNYKSTRDVKVNVPSAYAISQSYFEVREENY